MRQVLKIYCKYQITDPLQSKKYDEVLYHNYLVTL